MLSTCIPSVNSSHVAETLSCSWLTEGNLNTAKLRGLCPGSPLQGRSFRVKNFDTSVHEFLECSPRDVCKIIMHWYPDIYRNRIKQKLETPRIDQTLWSKHIFTRIFHSMLIIKPALFQVIWDRLWLEISFYWQ